MSKSALLDAVNLGRERSKWDILKAECENIGTNLSGVLIQQGTLKGRFIVPQTRGPYYTGRGSTSRAEQEYIVGPPLVDGLPDA